MDHLFEYSDILHSPIEAIHLTGEDKVFPVPSHWHYFVEILYLLKGQAVVTCNEQIYYMNEDEFIFIPPQAIHSIYGKDRDSSFEFIILKYNLDKITLQGDYLPNLHNLFKNKNLWKDFPIHYSQQETTHFRLKDFFSGVLHEVNEKAYGYDAYIYSYLSALTVKLLRHWQQQCSDLNERTTNYIHSEFTIQDVLPYIDEHSHQNINIQDLADRCSMSYSYFAKTFKQHYGQSCKQYIEFIRLSKVENLLLFTDYDLSYIAEETGFSDCSHLIRSFKKKYGMTPKQFRMKRH